MAFAHGLFIIVNQNLGLWAEYVPKVYKIIISHGSY